MALLRGSIGWVIVLLSMLHVLGGSPSLTVFTQANVAIQAGGEVAIDQTQPLPAGAVIERVVFRCEYSTYWYWEAVAGNYIKLNGSDVPGLGWGSVGTGRQWTAVQT